MATVMVRTDRTAVCVNVLLALTPRDQASGYTIRPEPPNDCEGMLFVFSVDNTPSFHMTGVPFDLDIVFGSENGIVVDACTMQSESGMTYSPRSPVRWALELKSGWCKRNGNPLHVTLPGTLD